VYGHAIKPSPRIKVEAETRVSLQDMKRMIRKTDRS
jgi:malonyl-CoA O-methyltransferase